MFAVFFIQDLIIPESRLQMSVASAILTRSGTINGRTQVESAAAKVTGEELLADHMTNHTVPKR